MKRQGLAALAFVGMLAASGLAHTEQPKTASELLETARKESGSKRKAIFVMFDASW